MSDNQWVTRQTLLVRAKNKDDHDAWEEFAFYYKEFISMLIFKMGFSGSDHDDITQEVLIKLWDNLALFDKEKASFRTWMSTVVRNLILNYQRAKGRQHERDKIAARRQSMIYESTSTEIENLIENEWKSYISDLAMKKIDGQFSKNAITVFLLTLKGKEVDEISKELNLKKDSVYVLRNRVKSRFQETVRSLVRELEY